jgi:hypothetical protein
MKPVCSVNVPIQIQFFGIHGLTSYIKRNNTDPGLNKKLFSKNAKVLFTPSQFIHSMVKSFSRKRNSFIKEANLEI